MSRALGALAVVSVVASMLGGCGRPAHAQDPAPAVLDALTLEMITDSGSYPDRSHRVEEVEVELTRQCMRAAGFAWQGSASEANPDAKDGFGASVDYLRRHGYGLSDDPNTAEPGTSDAADGQGALREALLGPDSAMGSVRSSTGMVFQYPLKGCGAKAYIALYGDLATWAQMYFLPQAIDMQLSRAARTDQRFLAKEAQWSTCMGGRHSSTETLVAGLRAAYRTDQRPLAQRRAAEVKLALEDRSCDKRVGLSATNLTIRRELARKLSAPDRAEMSRLAARFPDVEARGTAGSGTT